MKIDGVFATIDQGKKHHLVKQNTTKEKKKREKIKKMLRSYEYHSSRSSYYAENSTSSVEYYTEYAPRMQRFPGLTDEHAENFARMRQMPTMVSGFSRFPNVSDVFNKDPFFAETFEDHPKKNFHVNLQRQQAPRVHKKIHFLDQEKSGEIGGDGKDDYEEKNIDMDADRYIQHKRKNFGLRQ